jgi:hypothetical protein
MSSSGDPTQLDGQALLELHDASAAKIQVLQPTYYKPGAGFVESWVRKFHAQISLLCRRTRAIRLTTTLSALC